MSVALKDSSSVSSLIAVLNTDTVQGQHLVRLAVNPLNNAIKINTTAAISFVMKPLDSKDENSSQVWAFQGSDGQLYPAVGTATGALLVEL